MFEADRRVEHARAAHHVHTAGELVRLLEAAGFEDVDLRGPDGETPYALDAPRCLALARGGLAARR